MRTTYNSIDSAFKDYKDYIIKNGVLIEDERGDTLYQIPFMHIEFEDHVKNVSNVEFIPIPSNTFMNADALKDYHKQLLDEDRHNFVYTYGNRLRKWFNVDQLDVLCNRICENKNTRRAVAVTIQPDFDCVLDEIPCLQHIQLMIYNDELYMGVLFRSNDIRLAFVPNLYGLQSLHLDLAHHLGYPVGKFLYSSYNPHWKCNI